MVITPAEIAEVIVVTARCHSVPVTPELFESCFWELERSGGDASSVTDALVRGFNRVMQ